MEPGPQASWKRPQFRGSMPMVMFVQMPREQNSVPGQPKVRRSRFESRTGASLFRKRLMRFVGLREDTENPSTGEGRRPARDAAAMSPPGHIAWLLIFTTCRDSK
jgi:hypothetical protein